MAKVNVEVIGLNTAINNMEQYLRRKQHALLGVAAGAGESIRGDARRMAPRDLGELKASIISNVQEKRGRNITAEVTASAPYAGWVEWGTSPHFPPLKALEGWAQRHGIPARAVQWSISRKGTPAQPYMYPAYKKNKNGILAAVRRVMSSP